jgi:hypothetical protein
MTYAVKQERISHQQARIERHSDQSEPNTPLVLTIPAGGVPRRLDRINAAYNGVDLVTQTVTIEVISGLGPDFNETLPPIVIISDVKGSYVPSTDVWLSGDDGLVITAPAEGPPGVKQIETATVVGTITPGTLQIETATIVGTITPGTLQVETATIHETVPGTIVNGNINVTVTSAGMTGSGVPISVAVADNDTEAQIAGKVATALTNDVNVGGKFVVTNPGGAPTTVVLTAKVAAANDATLNVATADDTSIGLASTGSSANSTAGVAPGTGNATVIVTASGMTGTPETVSVAVVASDNATAVAGKIKTALGLNAHVNGFFTIGGTGADVVLTVKTKAADDSSMNIDVDNGTCTGLTDEPTSTHTLAGVAAGTGNATVIVTAAGMTGTPITVPVAVVASDTASQVATKIQTALGLNATIAAFFTIGGTGADVKLTRALKAADDSSMNIDVDNGTCTGLTDEPTSVHTTAGVAAGTETSAIVARLEEAGM